MNERQSFIAGFRYGVSRNARELTNREIEILFPKAHVDFFAQGMLDGLEGDDFRFSRLIKEETGESISDKFRKNPAAVGRLIKAMESDDLIS